MPKSPWPPFVCRLVALSIFVSPIVLAAQIPGVFDPVGEEVKKRTGLKKTEDDIKKNDPTGITKAPDAVAPVVRQVAGGTETTVRNFAGGTLKTLETGAGQGVKNIVNAGNTVVITYEKTWKNIGDQTPRTLQDTADAAQALVRFGRKQIEGEKEGINRGQNRLNEGKPVDAVWSNGVEHAQRTEQNFGEAARTSRVINAAASTAAAVYGGPAGAAAYAAWYTYRTTGDANEALRAGILAAVTYEAGSVANMPTGTAGELLQKAAFTGAVGGIAVAAAGGTEADVRDAFLRSAGAVLIQAGTDELKAYSPNARNAVEAVQCVSTMDVDCFSGMTYVRDAKRKVSYVAGQPKLEKLISKEVGRWTGTNFNTPNGKRLRQILKVSKLPNSEVIPLSTQ